MSHQQVLYSCGSDGYKIVGHENSNCEECFVLGDAKQIKRMACGRSHILYEKFNGELFSLGRNDYSQCAVSKSLNGELIKTPTNCLYKEGNDSGAPLRPVIKPFKFTTGWFHSIFISQDQKRIYFTGYYSGYSAMNQTKDSCFYDITETVLEKDMLQDDNYKITDVGSGDHSFAFVVDNEFIVVVENQTKVLHIPDLKEFLVFKSGVAFTRKGNGNLYLAKTYPNSVTEFDGKFIKNLSSASVSDSFSYLFNDRYKRFGYQNNSEPSTRFFEGFCTTYIYDNKERKFQDHAKFSKVNQELEKHQDWEILQLVAGSDSVHILLGVRDTKEELQFFEKLHKISQSNHFSDLLCTIITSTEY